MMMMVGVVVARVVVIVVVVIVGVMRIMMVVIYHGNDANLRIQTYVINTHKWKVLRLAMIQSMDGPGCYKAYVWGDFIHTKTIQNNEQGTNLPHQISNLEQMFP